MKKLLLTIILMITGLLSFSQTGSLNQPAKTDSIYLAEMMSRREIDKNTNEIKIDCPILGNPLCAIHTAKYINKGQSSYYLTLILRDTINQANIKGVTISFTDGTKLNKPEQKIDVIISDISHIYDDFRTKYKYQYLANFTLTPADLKILGSKTISKFQLSASEGEPKTKDAEEFRIYCKNIILTK